MKTLHDRSKLSPKEGTELMTYTEQKYETTKTTEKSQVKVNNCFELVFLRNNYEAES